MLSEDIRKIKREAEHLREENMEFRRLLEIEPLALMNCGCCKNFIQHYVKTGSVFHETYSGHCVHGRTTTKRPDGKACRYFELGRRNFY